MFFLAVPISAHNKDFPDFSAVYHPDDLTYDQVEVEEYRIAYMGAES